MMMEVLTGFMAVTTAVLAAFTYSLARSTKQLADSARDTAIRQLRAYVGVAGGTMYFPSPDSPIAEVVFKNSGQTPAYNVLQWIHMWIADHPLRVSLPDPPPDLGMSTGIMPPGGHNTMRMPKQPPVPAESVHLLGTPEGTIYIYGEIRYRDIFGVDRYTKYRLIYGGQKEVHEGHLKDDYEGNEAN